MLAWISHAAVRHVSTFAESQFVQWLNLTLWAHGLPLKIGTYIITVMKEIHWGLTNKFNLTPAACNLHINLKWFYLYIVLQSEGIFITNSALGAASLCCFLGMPTMWPCWYPKCSPCTEDKARSRQHNTEFSMWGPSCSNSPVPIKCNTLSSEIYLWPLLL